MKDKFYEQLISKKPRINPTALRVLVIALIVFLMTIGALMIGFISVIVAVVLGVSAFFYIFPHSSMEYEYSLLNYDLDIDAIYSQSKRENMVSFDIRQAEMIAPKGSSRLAPFRPEKTCNYTSGDPNAQVYCIIISLDKKLHCIMIEPDDTMIEHIRVWMGMRFSKN